MTILWSNPSCTGGSSINNYKVYINDGVSSTWNTVSCSPTVSLTSTIYCGILNLNAGSSYNVKVTAINAAGESVASPVLSIVSAIAPQPPSQPYLISSTQTSINVGWTAPTNDGGSTISLYELYGKASTDPESSWALLQSASTSVLTYTQSGIATSGIWLQYKVRSKSTFGYGDFSSVASFVSAKTPTMSAPTLVSATKTTITVSWTATDAGGSAITGYILSQADTATNVYSVVYNGKDISSILSYTSTVETGHTYKYTVVGINAAGTGSASAESATILAATVPGAPKPPIYSSSTTTTILLKFGDKNSDDGGSSVTRTHLYMAAVGSTLVEVTQYNGQDATYTVDKAIITTLSIGTTYQFAATSHNAVGESIRSDIVYIALGSLPAQMSTPTVNYATSTGDSLTISWGAGTSADLPITGYQLYMHNSPAVVVYDGRNNPTTRSTTITGLTKGVRYYFYVVAYNFNGASQASAELAAYACTAPKSLSVPTLKSSTATSLFLQWTPPTSDGSCPLLQYRLYRDDGSSGSITTEISAASFASQPSLTSFNVAGLAGLGNTFRFILRAENLVGYIDTSAVGFILASVPLKPPVFSYDASTSTYQNIKISFPTIPVGSNGGSALTGIELQRALSTSSTYDVVVQLTTGIITSYTDTSSTLVKGNTYKYHYRVANINGWSDFSDDLVVVAGSVPGITPAPAVTGLAAGQITLLVASPTDNGGMSITQVDLEMGAGATNPSFTVIKSGLADSTYTLGSSDGLTAGQIYSFRSRAKNAAGYGSYSNTAIVGAGTVPTSSPSSLASDVTKSSSTTIYLKWNAVTPAVGELPIVGYTISQKLTSAGDSTYVTAYDGSSNSAQLFTTITGLSAGTSYSFIAYAVNINGKSSGSTAIAVKACGAPNPPNAPTSSAADATGVTVAWSIPSNTGGCPLTGFDVYIYRTTTSSYDKVNTASDSDPTMTSFKCDTTCLPAGATLGSQYIFRIKSKNSAPATSTDSDSSLPILYAAVPGTPASAPSNNQAGTSTSRISIVLTAVSTTNGSPITSYELQMAVQSGTLTYATVQNANLLTATITSGITSGQTYVFRYRAINAIGAGGWSSTASILAAMVPSQMAAPTISLSGSSIRFSWTTATINGSPITKYNLQILTKDTRLFADSPCDGTSSTVISNQYCEVTPAILKSTYKYADLDIPAARISAANAIGTGIYSDSSSGTTVIPTVPAKPLTAPIKNVAATSGTTIQVDVSVLTGTTYTGGATISSYNIQWDQGTGTWVDLSNSLVLSATVTSLTLGTTYSFRYRGVNVMGSGTLSDTLTVTARNVPSQIATPTLTFSGDNLKVILTWTAPSANGGTISIYKVVAQGSSGSVTTNAYCTEGMLPTTTCTVPMSSFWASPFLLTTAGTALTMQVQAYNEAGWGTLSSSPTGVTIRTKPSAPPSAPTLDAASTFNSLKITWSALTTDQNGGSAITSYSLMWDAGSGSTPTTEIQNTLATTVTITTGIQAGANYKFIYAGVNVYGAGSYSSVATLRCPPTNPSAPDPPTTVKATDVVNICWNVPTSTGGSSIASYKIYVRDKSDLTYKLPTTQCLTPDIATRCCSVDILVLNNYFHLITGDEVKAKVTATNADNLESAQSAETTSGAIL